MGLTVSFGKWLILMKAWVTSLSTTEDSLIKRRRRKRRRRRRRRRKKGNIN